MGGSRTVDRGRMSMQLESFPVGEVKAVLVRLSRCMWKRRLEQSYSIAVVQARLVLCAVRDTRRRPQAVIDTLR